MVKLTFNLLGYAFQDGVNTLRLSYDSAREALVDDLDRAKAEAAAYEQSGDFIGERDEDGYVIWSQDQILEERIEAATGALRDLRKAFAIALYHAWERGARVWTNATNADHDKLAPKVQALGITIDPGLGDLRLMVNVLKHDKDRWGNALLAARPDLVDAVQITPPHRTDWYEAVIISEAAMIAFFDAVSASGPTSKTRFP